MSTTKSLAMLSAGFLISRRCSSAEYTNRSAAPPRTCTALGLLVMPSTTMRSIHSLLAKSPLNLDALQERESHTSSAAQPPVPIPHNPRTPDTPCKHQRVSLWRNAKLADQRLSTSKVVGVVVINIEQALGRSLQGCRMRVCGGEGSGEVRAVNPSPSPPPLPSQPRCRAQPPG